MYTKLSAQPGSATALGQKCAFPFVYRGVTYNKCTNTRHTALWCSTTPTYSGKWGNCQPTGRYSTTIIIITIVITILIIVSCYYDHHINLHTVAIIIIVLVSNRLRARDFYAVIVDEGKAGINYQHIEVESE